MVADPDDIMGDPGSGPVLRQHFERLIGSRAVAQGATATAAVVWGGPADGVNVIVTRSVPAVKLVDVPLPLHVVLVPTIEQEAIVDPPFLAKLTLHEAAPPGATSTTP